MSRPLLFVGKRTVVAVRSFDRRDSEKEEPAAGAHGGGVKDVY